MIARWSDWVYDVMRWALGLLFDPRTRAERRDEEWRTFNARHDAFMARMEADMARERSRAFAVEQAARAHAHQRECFMEREREYREHVETCPFDHKEIRAVGYPGITRWYCYGRPFTPSGGPHSTQEES